MLKWCAYCLHYLGDCEPFDDFQISHGVCPACAPRGLTFSSAEKQSLQGLRQFFGSLQRAAREQRQVDLGAILEEGRRLGVAPLDLMLGVFQPLLYEIGAQWAVGKLSVAMEHRFTALVDAWMTHHRTQAAAGTPAQSDPPRLILLNPEGNSHHLGLRMAESYYMAMAIPCLTIVPGLPLAEVLRLVDLHRPRALGFSVALPEQMQQVLKVAEGVKALPVPPEHILVGGAAVRRGAYVAPGLGLQVCRELADSLPFLQ